MKTTSSTEAKARRFGQLAGRITVPDDFDAPMDPADLTLWEGGG